MSRRGPLSRVQAQQRAASRMTVGTKMWSEQPINTPHERWRINKPAPASPKTIPTAAWVNTFGVGGGGSITIPDPPDLPGLIVISGAVILASEGTATDPVPPARWNKIGGYNMGGNNAWSTNVEVNVWAWNGTNGVKGGLVNPGWAGNYSHYMNGTVLYIYTDDLKKRGHWTCVNGPSFSTNGAGALSQGRVGVDVAPAFPAGASIGWQVGAMASYYTSPSATPDIAMNGGVMGHYHRSGGYGQFSDLSKLQAPDPAGRVEWNYFGAYGSPAGASFAAGWFPL